MNKNLIVAIVVVTPMMLLYLYGRFYYSDAKKLYTISNSIKYRGIRGRSDLTVEIKYNNKIYTINHAVSRSCIKRAQKGETLLIEFLKEDPTLGRILCDYTIPDSISRLEVWDSIPSFLEKRQKQ